MAQPAALLKRAPLGARRPQPARAAHATRHPGAEADCLHARKRTAPWGRLLAVSSAARSPSVAAGPARAAIPSERRLLLAWSICRGRSERRVKGARLSSDQEITTRRNGSVVPVRRVLVRPFSRDGRLAGGYRREQARPQDSDFRDDLRDGQVPRWTGRSLRKLPRAALVSRRHSTGRSRTAAASLMLPLAPSP